MNTYMKTIIIFQVMVKINATNLICNGDFESYTVLLDYLGEKYQYQISNYSCWYNKNGGIFEVKRKLYPPVTNTA